MSYRLIDSNAIAIKYPEVNEMPCVFADLPDGLNGQFIGAQPEQQWIPCSEFTGDGYPKEDGLYFVTEQNYGFYMDADVKQKVVHTCWFRYGSFIGRFYNCNNSNIVAWMPMIKPWEGDAE